MYTCTGNVLLFLKDLVTLFQPEQNWRSHAEPLSSIFLKISVTVFKHKVIIVDWDKTKQLGYFEETELPSL